MFSIPIILGSNIAYLLFILSISQLLAAPIQGSLSDHYCRKRSLLFATFAVIGGQILILSGISTPDHSTLAFAFLLTGFLLDGCLGNVTTIARAALIDSNYLGSPRKALGYSFILIGLPWIIVFFFHSKLNLSISTSIALNVISFVTIYLYFLDQKDKGKESKTSSLTHDFNAFFKFFNSKIFLFGTFAFLISEMGFNFMFLFESEIFRNRTASFIYPLFGLGFSCGALFQNLVEVPKQNMKGIILLGFAVSIFSIVILPIFFYFQDGSSFNDEFIWTQGASILAAAAGFYFPTLFALLSQNHPIHEQGKVFGFLESVQTLGEVAVTILLFSFHSYITQNTVVICSAFLFTVAFLIFKLFFNEKPNSAAHS